ncbi:hypothetical protein K491DRAFT_592165 [Lophiostoma macrostomum CBS 122681]|uniref:Uncharacterized protein n=1 Tax=Lophiostoma macrostomum CBS 122681 TaxID=1314788 RepID=A0A6A6TK01_9PLEO|nr:hypothetical protein K491DRAFT_592165 [Lophiostoma macrostomum CBS 122681]
MLDPPADSLRAYIYHRINAHRGGLPENVSWLMAENISFLIRHHHGSAIDIDLNSISFARIDVRGRDNCEIGHKAAVVVHEAPGKTSIIVDVQVGWSKNVMVALTEKVDRMVNDILVKAGKEAKKK